MFTWLGRPRAGRSTLCARYRAATASRHAGHGSRESDEAAFIHGTVIDADGGRTGVAVLPA
ncbi:hypothetical protein [Glycomyces tritici]|uniref:Uncharacterized protein n=1 Tax=Glycomyces tritici TaxID=2665176 RepID=A0ABT7YXN7_9ACTN|nr:hypothetical protein [Glycomyces tritici]MDN3243374.1 hypothetical protein [Glycomyces tritici]MDN3243749.1 hypothetical protein [Glycomyces tritici]